MRYKVNFEADGPLSDVLVAVESLGAKVHNLSVMEVAGGDAITIIAPRPKIERRTPALDAVTAFINGLAIGAEFTVTDAGAVLPPLGFAAGSASPIISGMRKDGVVRYVRRSTYARAK